MYWAAFVPHLRPLTPGTNSKHILTIRKGEFADWAHTHTQIPTELYVIRYSLSKPLADIGVAGQCTRCSTHTHTHTRTHTHTITQTDARTWPDRPTLLLG